MNLSLFVKDTPVVTELINKINFEVSRDDSYRLDGEIMEHLDCDEQCPEGFRPVAVHILPFTKVDGKPVYYAFHGAQQPTLYVSFQITQEDFVAPPGGRTMSLCRTIVGKIIRLFDQPHIGITINKDHFVFPSVINGEFVWAVEVQGDNHQVVDQMVAQLGTIIGRLKEDSETPLNGLSQRILAYLGEPAKNDLAVEDPSCD